MIKKFKNKTPQLGKNVFVDENSCVTGNVILENNVSVWPFASIRGDMNKIIVGRNSNIQDNSSVHTKLDNITKVGENVTVGHNAVLHGCFIGDNCLIGMGAILLDDVKIGDNCIIAAGSVVSPGTEIPDNSLALGVPAKVVKKIGEKEVEAIKNNSLDYLKLAAEYI
ncbi:MAG: gamma carbonic anhydrase family protein [Candidatus Muiribacteriota bacterium]